jgi:O-acetyl-ADP-ribose deacetylase (regulator of RNase III)
VIKFIIGNIFEAKTQAIVNPVNCKGVMGKGIAITIKIKYPDVFNAYEDDCDRGLYKPGGVRIYRQTSKDKLPMYVVCFATKDHWNEPSNLDWIKVGLSNLAEVIHFNGIKSISLPKLGCGNGKLEWKDVKSLIQEALSDIDCDVVVYE